MIQSSPLNSTHYAMFYPQDGDRDMTIDSVTSLYPRSRMIAQAAMEALVRVSAELTRLAAA